MIPERMKNLIPACKNIVTTHLTNGCYRLHPVEWNVGEVAGLLASFAIEQGATTEQVWADKELFDQFCQLLEKHGIQRYWDETIPDEECFPECQRRKSYC